MSAQKNAANYQGSDRLILGIVMGVLTFWLFALSMLSIVPSVQKTLGSDLNSINLAVSLTGLFSGCFIVAAGGLADRFGRVRFTYIGLILSIVGSLCLILAKSDVLFTVGRIIQGFSAACVMPSTLAIVKAYFDGKARQRALSFWSIGSWGGAGSSSFFGGAIATYVGWQFIFVLSIIFALMSMLLIRGTPETKMDKQEKSACFDYAGLGLFVVALVTLNLLITKGSAFGWTSPITLSLLIICLLFTGAFFVVEKKKGSDAFIDFALFRNKAYSGTSFSNFMINSAAGTLMVVSLYLQKGRELTPFQASMTSIGYLIMVLLMIRVGEKVLQRVGAKKPMLVGTMTTGVGIMLMTMTHLPDTTYFVMVSIGFLLFGLGLGFYATPSTDTAIANAPVERVGVASGIFKMASSLGGALGLSISATVYAVVLSSSGSISEAATAGLLVNALFCILSFLAVIFMVPRNAGKPSP